MISDCSVVKTTDDYFVLVYVRRSGSNVKPIEVAKAAQAVIDSEEIQNVSFRLAIPIETMPLNSSDKKLVRLLQTVAEAALSASAMAQSANQDRIPSSEPVALKISEMAADLFQRPELSGSNFDFRESGMTSLIAVRLAQRLRNTYEYSTDGHELLTPGMTPMKLAVDIAVMLEETQRLDTVVDGQTNGMGVPIGLTTSKVSDRWFHKYHSKTFVDEYELAPVSKRFLAFWTVPELSTVGRGLVLSKILHGTPYIYGATDEANVMCQITHSKSLNLDYHIQIPIELQIKSVDLGRLERALLRLLEVHPVLKTKADGKLTLATFVTKPSSKGKIGDVSHRAQNNTVYFASYINLLNYCVSNRPCRAS